MGFEMEEGTREERYREWEGWRKDRKEGGGGSTELRKVEGSPSFPSPLGHYAD
jgi:hypothetical protein